MFHWSNEGKNNNYILGNKKEKIRRVCTEIESKNFQNFYPEGKYRLDRVYNWSEHKSFINLTATTKVLKCVLFPPDFIKRNTLIVPSGN